MGAPGRPGRSCRTPTPERLRRRPPAPRVSLERANAPPRLHRLRHPCRRSAVPTGAPRLADVVASLDVRDVPEVFVQSDPRPQATALGVDRPFIVVTSGMLDLLDDEELRFVLLHELGHIQSGHALYTTMLLQLMRMAASLSWLSVGALGLRGIIGALHERQRKAELSGDRAGLLAVQDSGAGLRVQMRIATPSPSSVPPSSGVGWTRARTPPSSPVTTPGAPTTAPPPSATRSATPLATTVVVRGVAGSAPLAHP